MEWENFHFVGIGGVSMSGLAEVMVAQGKRVTGSDMSETPFLDRLRKLGVKIHIGHDAKYINDDVEVVVVSAAIDETNPEVMASRMKNIKIIKRSELIGLLMDDKVGIAVAGMHGKSTVTAMLAELLIDAEEDPTVLSGAQVKKIGSQTRVGKSDLVVAEACEYKKSFLDMTPQIEIINNVEPEHLDCYKDLNEIIDTFKIFVKKLPENGLAVICLDGDNTKKLLDVAKCFVIGFGLEDKPNDFSGVYWQVKNYQWKNDSATFDIWVDEEKCYENVRLMIPGIFNALNATAVLAVCDFLVIDREKILTSLSKFSGAKRRFDVVGMCNKAIIIDDYAHHPTEIKSLISALRMKYKDKKLYIVYQPHQYSRTKMFLDELTNVWEGVQEVIIPNIYESRDSGLDKMNVSVKILIDKISENGIRVKGDMTFEEVTAYLRKNIDKDSVVVTVGAGDVDKIAYDLVKA